MRYRRQWSRSSRTRRVAAGLIVFGMLLVAGSDSGQARQQAPDGYPADGQPAIVKLLSNGAEPRRELRYRPAAGTAARMDMRMEMAMTLDMGGMSMPVPAMPAMTMTADTVITEVTGTGDFSYRMTFVDAGAESMPGADPGMVSMLRTMMQSSLKGFSGTGTVSARGVPRAVSLDLSGVSDPQMRQAMSSVTASLEQMSIPLPEEPVGAGASWEVYQRITQAGMGMVVFQKGVATVTAIDGDKVTLALAIEQQAPRQAMQIPGVPAEVEMYLQRLTGSGTGTTTVDLTSLIPTSAVSARTTVEVEMSTGGNAQVMAMGTTLKMTMTPGR